jgi:uncharacterized protein (DUF2062 family)
MIRVKRPVSLKQRVLWALRPPGGWRRALVFYWKTLVRQPSAAHAVAFGTAIGVFASFLPLIGLRLLISVASAAAARANPVAAAVGSQFGHPLIYPILLAASVELGLVLLRSLQMQTEENSSLYGLVGPALLGLLVAGCVTSILVYFFVLVGFRSYQARRAERIMLARRSR